LNYCEAVEYLIGSYTKGHKHDVEVHKAFLERLGNPHEKLKIIHVAGTNGKGSVCAMTASILRKAGYTTGVFSSPHLITFNERFSINGQLISDGDFAEEMGLVKEISAEVFGNEEDSLSFFEILTFMAFHYFYINKVDYAIIETGIGGRQDVTNIIPQPLVSVITSIGYDHMNVLGDTLEAIAQEKAGIIKANRPAVMYLTSNRVYNTIKPIAEALNSKLYCASCELDILKKDLHETVFSVDCELFSYNSIKIGLIGDYQIQNAICALLCVEALRDAGVALAESHVREGLAAARWPGRLEVAQDNTLVILDGAHNVDGAEAFRGFARNMLRGRRIIMVIGILKSKAYEAMIDIMTETADTVIFTQAISGLSTPAEILAQCVSRSDVEVVIEPDYAKAYEKAVELAASGAAGASGAVFIGGSLYLIGDIRKYLIGKGVIDDRFQGRDK
jgi:dihydrofolate synthase/folylpolyglutamate synthase